MPPPMAVTHPHAREVAASPDSAFDRWLREGLARHYGAMLREPVPGELLRLVAEAPLSRRGR